MVKFIEIQWFMATKKWLSIFLFIGGSVFAQNTTTESELLEKIAHARNKNDSILAMIELSESYRFSHPDEGLKIARKALSLSYFLSDTSLMIRSANKLAILEKENSMATSALGTIIKSLTWAEESKNDSLIANAKLVAGHVYSSLNNDKLAIDNYKGCLAFYKSINDSSGISYTYSGLGIVYYDNEEYDDALNSYLNAEIYWADSESSLKADLWNNIGALYIEKQDYQNARYYYNKALRFYKVENWLSEISMVFYNLGELHLLENDIAKASEYFNKSLKIGEEIGSYTEIIWAYQGLYLTSKKANNYSDALMYHELYTNMKDSIHRLQNRQEVRELEALFHQEKQLKKIKDQQLKIAQGERKVESEKFKNLVFIVIIIFILCLLFFGIIYYRKSRNHNKTLLQQQKVISNTLNEKELLLQEIHHRVKNNLQVISSLLNLQSNSADNELTKYVIEETQNRIKAIALVHQKLYQSKNIGKIDFNTYLKELVEQQSQIYKNENTDINCNVEAPNSVELDLDIAVSLGLIASELITNAFKYAFVNRENNQLTISLLDLENNHYQLIIHDNGIGLPPEFENGEKESLGMDLVKILTEQINGEMNCQNDNGAKFTILFNA